jgi:hypothetical protein
MRVGDILVCHAARDDLPTTEVQWLGGQRFMAMREHRIFDRRYRRSWVVPDGFQFDGASAPRIVWAFVSPLDLGVLATMTHDYLYRFGGRAGAYQYDRREADNLMWDLMMLELVPAWRRQWSYSVIRAVGAGAWRSIV